MKILKPVISEIKSLFQRSEKVEEPTFSTMDLSPRELSLADPPSRISDPKYDWEKLFKGGYRVKVKRGIKKITLFRFLTAKLLYEESGIHLDEFIILFELYSDLMASNDPGFNRKYEEWFIQTSNFFNVVTKNQNFPCRIQNKAKREELAQWMKPVLPSKSAYFGLKGQRNIRNSFVLQLNDTLPPQRVPPKSYIGVGYRDKGTRKESHDGRPSWQEVASHYSELERRNEEITEDPGIPPDSLSTN